MRYYYCGLIIYFLLSWHTSQAQEIFQKGYIITLRGDTINGLVAAGKWKRNPKTVSFKKLLQEQSKSFDPLSIQRFYVGDRLYVGAVVQRSTNSGSDANKISPEVEYQKDTVFLQVMIEGNKNLYHLNDEDGRDHFFITDDEGNYQALIYKFYYFDDDGEQKLLANDQYRRQLIRYFSGCPPLSKVILKTKYKTTDLLELFNKYFRCDEGADKSYIQEQDISWIYPGLIIGFSHTKLIFKSDHPYFDHLSKADFKPSYNITAGIQADLIFPTNKRLWSINNELMYYAFNAKGTLSSYVNEEQYKNIYSTFDFRYLKLNTLLKYKIEAHKGYFFLNGGFSNAVAFEKTNNKLVEEMDFYGLTFTETKAMDRIRRYEQAYVIGLGGNVGQVSVEARFEKGNGISKYIALQSKTTKYHLLLRYQFKKKK